MRPLQRRRRGLSEIVGTLMLVLIVVSAAVAFSLFVAAYEKQLTNEQSFSQQRSLESLRVLSVAPVLNVSNGGTTWTTVTFVLASEYVNPSVVTSISVNGHALRSYNATPVSSGGANITTVTYASTLAIPPRAQVDVSVDFVNASPFYSFFDPAFVLPSSSFLKVDVYTAYQNDFSATFVPPTAIAIVSGLVTLNGGLPETIPILDGSNSFQPVNGTLVHWAWTVNETAPALVNGTAVGEKATFPSVFGSPLPASGNYTITLVVTDSYGLLAATTIDYVQS